MQESFRSEKSISVFLRLGNTSQTQGRHATLRLLAWLRLALQLLPISNQAYRTALPKTVTISNQEQGQERHY